MFHIDGAEIWWDPDDPLRIDYVLRGPRGFERRTYVTDIDGRVHYDPVLYREMAEFLTKAGKPQPEWSVS